MVHAASPEASVAPVRGCCVVPLPNVSTTERPLLGETPSSVKTAQVRRCPGREMRVTGVSEAGLLQGDSERLAVSAAEVLVVLGESRRHRVDASRFLCPGVPRAATRVRYGRNSAVRSRHSSHVIVLTQR